MRTFKFLLLTPLLLYIFACQREGFITDSSAKVSFSLDTVYFDTVFTTLSTVTRRFTVKNPHKEFIKISTVNLAGGDASVYRINFDGISGTEFKNIEIAPKDSLFIFVQATLDPNSSKDILLQQDSIIFVTNQNVQDIDLVAWGQDVHILRDSMLLTQTWTNDKPYLILDAVGVDSLSELTIEAGTKVYFHRDGLFIVWGSVKINGTFENPVVFQGDRLEKLYSDFPGQWQGMLFLPGSKNNIINYAQIKGGIFGILLGANIESSYPIDMAISNSSIQHMSAFGIRAADARISGYNNLITSCGISALAFELGGNYEFHHTTIANYFNFNSRKTPSVIITNYVKLSEEQGGGIIARDLEQATFGNCIVYGNQPTEISWDSDENALFNFGFENSLIKLDTSLIPLEEMIHFTNCINYKDPLFLNTDEYDFHFDTLEISPARDFGSLDIGNLYPLDLDGVSRIADGKPDAGAYEFLKPE